MCLYAGRDDMKTITLKILRKVMMKKGYSSYFASRVPQMFIKDLLQSENISFKQKKWAYQKGFLSSRAHTYRINESNYKDHMPDFDYYKLSPIDGRYSAWIDDKLTMKYMLRPFDEYLPEYYFQLTESGILRLMDCPCDIGSDLSGVLELLRREGHLTFKALAGSLGEGFYKLSYKNNIYCINNKTSDLKDVEALLLNLKGYLVTEYILSHDSIRKIYDVTPNTLRVQLIRNEDKKPKITGSFIRFGTRESGVLETPLAGGIIAGVDLINGRTFDANIIINQNLKNIKYHPDTNEDLELVLPAWEDIKLKVEEISDYMPQLSYLGFDIIITNEGFRIIEINSLTAPTVLSYYYPLFADGYSKEYFTKKCQMRPTKFRRLLKMLSERVS